MALLVPAGCRWWIIWRTQDTVRAVAWWKPRGFHQASQTISFGCTFFRKRSLDTFPWWPGRRVFRWRVHLAPLGM